MKRKRFTEEQIIRILKAGGGRRREGSVSKHGMSDASFYTWWPRTGMECIRSRS
ncbi:MAG: transposase [Candidatus Binatia bacterium]